VTGPDTPRLTQEAKDATSEALLVRLATTIDEVLASMPCAQQPGWFQRYDDQRAAGIPGASPFAIVVHVLTSEGEGPNLLLIEALRYYGERRTLANPKGWARVLRAVNQGIDANVIPSTPEQQKEAREVLTRLAGAEQAASENGDERG